MIEVIKLLQITDDAVAGASAQLKVASNHANGSARPVSQHNNVNGSASTNKTEAASNWSVGNTSASASNNNSESNKFSNNMHIGEQSDQIRNVNTAIYEEMDLPTAISDRFDGATGIANEDHYENANSEEYCIVDDDMHESKPQHFTVETSEGSNAAINPNYNSSNSMIRRVLGPLPTPNYRNNLGIDVNEASFGSAGIYENDGDEIIHENGEHLHDEESVATATTPPNQRNESYYETVEDIDNEPYVLDMNCVTKWKNQQVDDDSLHALIMNGFNDVEAEQALKIAKNDLEIAICILKLYKPK